MKMEIKTTIEVIQWHNKGVMPQCCRLQEKVRNKEWVALTEEVIEAICLYRHLKNHKEVQETPIYKGMPVCKICGKSAYQIKCEEWS